MAGWFELSKSSDNQFRFVLKAGNGETILTSELYTSKASAEKGIAALSSKLDNPGFVAKAPAHVVDGERAKLAKARERLAKIEESIAAFS